MTYDRNDLDKAARAKVLSSIHDRTANAIDEILKNTDPGDLNASMLQSINAFLRLNDVSAGTIEDEDTNTREVRALSAKVRQMKEDEEREKIEAEARGETVIGPMLGNVQSEPFEDR